MEKHTLPQSIDAVLQYQFGFASFRPGQRESIQALLTHGQLLCIQPTGYGKSLLYQLTAVLLDGLTLVISPLLALMRDQIDQLNQRFGITAASINTDQTLEENEAARQDALNGEVKILFIAPEQLDHLESYQFLLALNISLVVVDEAHCISTWGHDFRPSYRQIIHLIHALKNKIPVLKILGLTATANHKVEQDICHQLADKQKIIVTRESMNRPNIQLAVLRAGGYAIKLATVGKLVNQLTGTGLIYCATRDNTEKVALYLQALGMSAASYHAGYAPEVKRQLQQDFLNNKYRVIAATNALGMGIDKADLRYIIHFDVPGSITAYYQEVGRCGRDGNPAHGILLYNETDTRIQQHFIRSAQPTESEFQHILKLVRESPQPLTHTDIKQLSGLHVTLVTVIIAELTEQGLLRKERQSGAQVYAPTAKKIAPNLMRYKNQLRVRTMELNAMIGYAEQSKTCLMKILRDALGDVTSEICGHCSVCSVSPFTLEYSTEKIAAIL